MSSSTVMTFWPCDVDWWNSWNKLDDLTHHALLLPIITCCYGGSAIVPRIGASAFDWLLWRFITIRKLIFYGWQIATNGSFIETKNLETALNVVHNVLNELLALLYTVVFMSPLLHKADKEVAGTVSILINQTHEVIVAQNGRVRRLAVYKCLDT